MSKFNKTLNTGPFVKTPEGKIYKKRIKAWVDALRSGKYPQARKTLRAPEGYCCLGVACDVFRRRTRKGRWEKDDAGFLFAIDDERSSCGLLPQPVADYFGFAVSNIIDGCIDPIIEKRHMNAIRVNDELGWSFEKIADAVEKYYLSESDK